MTQHNSHTHLHTAIEVRTPLEMRDAIRNLEHCIVIRCDADPSLTETIQTQLALISIAIIPKPEFFSVPVYTIQRSKEGFLSLLTQKELKKSNLLATIINGYVVLFNSKLNLFHPISIECNGKVVYGKKQRP